MLFNANQTPHTQIDRRRKEVGGQLRVHIFVSLELKQLIVTPVTDYGGLIAEKDNARKMSIDTPVEETGSAILAALLAHEKPMTMPSLAHHKASDWPSYKVSGEKSIKSFQRRYTSVTIETHPTCLELRAATLNPLEDQLWVGAYESMQPDEWKPTALKLVRAIEAVRNADI